MQKKTLKRVPFFLRYESLYDHVCLDSVQHLLSLDDKIWILDQIQDLTEYLEDIQLGLSEEITPSKIMLNHLGSIQVDIPIKENCEKKELTYLMQQLGVSELKEADVD